MCYTVTWKFALNSVKFRRTRQSNEAPSLDSIRLLNKTKRTSTAEKIRMNVSNGKEYFETLFGLRLKDITKVLPMPIFILLSRHQF